MRPKEKIMYIEYKGDDGIFGAARIGRVRYSKSGKSVHYSGMTFQTLKGVGFKANYFDVDTGDYYWISGCRKGGRDALYSTQVTVDEDAREEYWCEIRGIPENKHITSFCSVGKCR